MFEWARTVLPCVSGEYSSNMILESVKILGLGALASSRVKRRFNGAHLHHGLEL